MLRDEKGRFMKKNDGNGYYIQIPSFFSLFKMLIISIILYPWYYILNKGNYLEMVFEKIFFTNVTTPTPTPQNGAYGGKNGS
jgi:hypothetical protein